MDRRYIGQVGRSLSRHFKFAGFWAASLSFPIPSILLVFASSFPLFRDKPTEVARFIFISSITTVFAYISLPFCTTDGRIFRRLSNITYLSAKMRGALEVACLELVYLKGCWNTGDGISSKYH